MLVLYTISGFFGSTTGTGRSPPPIFMAGRGSSVIFRQLASRHRQNGRLLALYRWHSRPSSVVANVAYRRCGSLAAIGNINLHQILGQAIRQWLPCACLRRSDLNRPPFVPAYSLSSSHGPSRSFHSDAYTTCGSLGSITTSEPPVLSSLYKTLLPGFAAIGRAENPSLGIGAVGMPQHRGE